MAAIALLLACSASGYFDMPPEFVVLASATILLAGSASRIIEKVENVPSRDARLVAGISLAFFSVNSVAISVLAYFVGQLARLMWP